jgi:uncharacterized protein (DUF1501 family)
MSTTRREFLRRSAMAALGLGMAGGAADPAFAQPAPAATTGAAADGPPVVVVITLDGGNDGLNTVVPLGQYDLYRQLRPNVGMPPEQLLPLSGYEEDFALTSALAPLADLFDLGQVAIVNGTGPPADGSFLFNHEASRRFFETAGVRAESTGWLGRFLDATAEAGGLPAGIDFGTTSVTLQGERAAPLVLQSIDTFRIAPGADPAARLAAYGRLQSIPFLGGGPAEYSRRQREQLIEFSDLLRGILSAHATAPGVSYPGARFAQTLRDCAAIIVAEPRARAFAVRTGGFDTHSNQNDTFAGTESLGFHERLLANLGGGVAAFHADLAGHGVGHRVVTVIHSEFGRRAPENITLGTDHGFGSVMFVIGEAVRGGVYGDPPLLDRLVLDGNLDVLIDFRSVFATVLDRHLGADPEEFLGGRFPALALL